jgi:hypothetical protein
MVFQVLNCLIDIIGLCFNKMNAFHRTLHWIFLSIIIRCAAFVLLLKKTRHFWLVLLLKLACERGNVHVLCVSDPFKLGWTDAVLKKVSICKLRILVFLVLLALVAMHILLAFDLNNLFEWFAVLLVGNVLFKSVVNLLGHFLRFYYWYLL